MYKKLQGRTGDRKVIGSFWCKEDLIGWLFLRLFGCFGGVLEVLWRRFVPMGKIDRTVLFFMSFLVDKGGKKGMFVSG